MITNHKPIIQRLRGGIGAQGFSQAVNIFIRLAEVPLFLTFWGAERYGEWLMVTAIPAYLVMADGGLTGTTQREMTMRMGSGDKQGALSAFQSTWAMLLAISVVFTCLMYGVLAFLPVDQFIHLKSISADALRHILLLFTVHVLLSFQCSLISGGYASDGRYARGTFLLASTYLLDFIGIVIAVAVGGGPVEVAMCLVFARTLGLLMLLIDKIRLLPWLTYGFSHASKAKIRQLLWPSLASLALPLGNALNIQGMTILVGLVMGPTTVTIFTALRTLARIAIQPRVIVNRLIEPEISMAYGKGNAGILNMLLNHASRLVFWVVGLCCLLLFLAGETIVEYWTSGRIHMSWVIFGPLLISVLINSVWYTAFVLIFATNRHERTAIEYLLIYGLGMLVIGYFALVNLGIAGIGVTAILAELVMAVLVISRVCRLSDQKISEWSKQLLKVPSLATYIRKI